MQDGSNPCVTVPRRSKSECLAPSAHDTFTGSVGQRVDRVALLPGGQMPARTPNGDQEASEMTNGENLVSAQDYTR